MPRAHSLPFTPTSTHTTTLHLVGNWPYPVEVNEYELPMHGLPAPWEGRTFLHLTDLHGGFGNTAQAHELAVAAVRDHQPDLILLTGDYLDDHPNEKDYPIGDILTQLTAPFGTWACLGNHDHRRGPVGSRRLLEQSGIALLDNRSVCLPGGLWLAGVDDLEEGEPDVAAALGDLPADQTSLVLSHNPMLIEQVGDRDVFILSGHTHGAQICLPFPSPSLVCKFHLRCNQVSGGYENGRARQYVSRGVGVTGRALRFRCPAEIALFTLRQP